MLSGFRFHGTVGDQPTATMTAVMVRRSLTSPIQALSDRGLVALLAMGLVVGALLVFFDLGPPLAFNDDWVYAWGVRQLVTGHGLRLFPEQSVSAVVGVVWAAVVTVGHTDQRLLRLSALPFVGLLVWGIFSVARRLGADPYWAAAAGGAMLFQPIFLGVATSFMTEPFYLAFLMLAAVSGMSWLTTGRGKVPTVLLAALATLERPNGIGIAIALTVALIVFRRNINARDASALLAVWALSALAVAFPRLAGLETQMQALRIHQLPQLDAFVFSVDNLFRMALYLPGILGLFCAPFLGALLVRSHTTEPDTPPRTRGPRVGVVARGTVICLAVGAALWLTLGRVPTLPGDYLMPSGLGPPHVEGSKPNLFPAWIFLAIEAVAVVSFVGLVMGTRRLGRWREWPIGLQFLLLLSVAQLVPLLYGRSFDRYYLAVSAPLLPVVALCVSRVGAPSAARNWAVCTFLVGILLYGVGEQDYQAWQRARDEAASRAYAVAGPLGVNAGYEANGTYAEIPLNEQGQGLLRPLTGPLSPGLPSFAGPVNPRLVLRFAPNSDGRPGVQYWSLAPGKIIIAEPRDTAPYKPPG